MTIREMHVDHFEKWLLQLRSFLTTERGRASRLAEHLGVFRSINTQPSTFNQSELPRCIIRSAPVSDTGGPGAKPGEATNAFGELPMLNDQ